MKSVYLVLIGTALFFTACGGDKKNDGCVTAKNTIQTAQKAVAVPAPGAGAGAGNAPTPTPPLNKCDNGSGNTEEGAGKNIANCITEDAEGMACIQYNFTGDAAATSQAREAAEAGCREGNGQLTSACSAADSVGICSITKDGFDLRIFAFKVTREKFEQECNKIGKIVR